MSKRNSFTFGPHRRRKFGYGYNQYYGQYQSLYNSFNTRNNTTTYQNELNQLTSMGFNDTTLIAQALNATSGDVTQAVGILTAQSDP